ncbi:MAG: hypothetical protein ACOZAA_18670 [Pseudomonadota bacterium]
MEQDAAARKINGNQPTMAGEAETAEYIGDLLVQLERLARTHGLVRLQYLLRSCQEEAAKVAGGR